MKIDCPLCGGIGKVEEMSVKQVCEKRLLIPVEKDCPDCEGTGKIDW